MFCCPVTIYFLVPNSDLKQTFEVSLPSLALIPQRFQIIGREVVTGSVQSQLFVLGLCNRVFWGEDSGGSINLKGLCFGTVFSRTLIEYSGGIIFVCRATC